MFKNMSCLIMLILLVFCVNLSAEKLVLVNLKSVNDLNILERLHLRTALQDNEKVIFIMDNETDLIKNSISYRILSDDMDSSPLYLISSKTNKDINSYFEDKSIVFRDKNDFIISDNNLNLIELMKNDLKAVKIERTQRIFKNLKKSYNNEHKVPLRIDQNVLNNINADSIGSYIQSLQDFQTRYALHPNRTQVALWIKNQFLRFGFTDVVLDSFYINYNGGYWQKNVIATLPGSLLPDQFVLIGGHHDSIISFGGTDPMIFAPGADDNASGTAAVIEVARAMKLANYTPKTSLRFCTYAMEEFGLYGSKYDAYLADENNMKIRAMINNDMIASQISPDWKAHLQNYAGSEFLTNLAVDFIDNNPNLAYEISYTNTSGSDSWSYWQHGFPAIFLAEYEFSPNYHSAQDITAYCNLPYAKEMVKLAASMVMYISEIPSSPENFAIKNVGNGSSLRAQWDLIPDAGNPNYKLTITNLQNQTTNTYNTTDNHFLFTGLTEGINYNISLLAEINNLQSIKEEIVFSPKSLPSPTQYFSAIPSLNNNHLTWELTDDLDISNCRIFKKTLSQATPEILINLPATSTEYVFVPDNDTTQYYYAMAMVDSDNNVSELSNFLLVRPITLNHGLLVLDDTYNGNGSIFLPSDLQVDNFYNSILNGYEFSCLETSTEDPYTIFDLAPYSAVIYHRNTSNVSDIVSNIPYLKSYLDFGGKLIISSYKPSQSFSSAPGYPASFAEGSFVRDYLKIDSSSLNSSARFKYGESLANYFNDIYTDTTKTHPNLQYRLTNIEAIVPTNQATAIYSYQSGFPDDNTFSEMNDLITGIMYNGEDFKTMTLTFPLYFMNTDQSRNLIRNALHSFGIPNANENIVNTKPNVSLLLANYPNPFNPVTKIPYYLPKASEISIKIYNIKGQLVKTFNNGYQLSGNHDLIWNGTDKDNKVQASGIYFYSLQVNGKITDTKKMLLLK